MYLKIVMFLCIVCMGLFSSCAAYRQTAVIPEPRPLGDEYEVFHAPDGGKPPETPLFPELSQQPLALEKALSLALLYSPELAAFSYEIRAAEARALQAGLYPNPELDVEMENLGGTGDLRGFRGTETTVGIAQSLLLAGKRYKRMQVAALQSDLAAWDYESKRLDVFTRVREAFIEVLAAQERVKLNQRLVELSRQLVASIAQRVRAGKISPAELSRAQVVQSTTEVELERARRELQAARQQLAATWGSKTADFTEALGQLDTVFTVPPVDKLIPLLSQNPDLARFGTELELRQARIALEDALRIPDPTIAGAVRRINETDDTAFVLSLSVPLPLFDRNQGARQEARINWRKALRERQAVEVQLRSDLIAAYNTLQSAVNEVNVLKSRILPEAENAYRTINEGYLQGRFDFLDVLDAQRTLFEVRGQYLSALRELHRSAAEVERLISQELNSIP